MTPAQHHLIYPGQPEFPMTYGPGGGAPTQHEHFQQQWSTPSPSAFPSGGTGFNYMLINPD